MIKKLLFFVSLFVLLSPKTYADQTQTDYWGYDLTHFTTGQFNNCLDSTNCGDTIQTIPYWGYNTDLTLQYPGFMSTTINTVANSYGAMFNFNTNQTLTTDYYYSLQLFMCNMTNNVLPTFVDLYGSTTWTNLENYNSKVSLKHNYNNITLADEPYPSYGTSSSGGTSEGSTCRAFTVIFKPAVKTTILGLQFTTSSTTNARWWMVGYKLDNLGFSNYLTSSQVENILDNSGFATADSVEEVDQSINEVKQEIAGMEDQQIQTNEKLDNLNDNITNNNVSGVEESFSQFEDFLDDNSTITQLITLPVTLYSSILQGISNSCTPFNLGTLYGESLVLPCVNIGNYLGSTLWGMIDLIISGFAIYSISKKLIKVFNNFSSMKDGDVIDD